MLRCQIGAVVFEREPSLLIQKIFQRKVGSVVTVGTEHCERQIRLYIRKQRIERYSFPGSAEFRPSCYAVQINGDRLRGQVPKRVPIPSLNDVTAIVDRKLPAVE